MVKKTRNSNLPCLDELVEKTIETLQELGITNPLIYPYGIRHQTGIWSRILKKCKLEFNCHRNLMLYAMWKRNVKSYASQVTKKLNESCKIPCNSNENIVEKIEPKQYIEHQQYSIELKFDSSEIAQIRLHIYLGIRQRFRTSFTRILNKKFEEHGVNCNLKCNNNWFTSSNSEKGYWRGLYKCKFQNCKATYECFIDKWNDKQLTIRVLSNSVCCHEKLEEAFAIRGKERERVAGLIFQHGVLNVANDNTTYSNKVTLRKIKSEFRNEMRISSDIFTDAEASKTLCQLLCLHPDIEGQNGFVQEINQNPFGLILLSDIQLRTWQIITKKTNNRGILHFDATGSVLNKIKDQKMPFLYSLVYHDKENKFNIPIFEFISTANDTTTISKYLLVFKMRLSTISKDAILVRFIVTDFSWALINAVLGIFNNLNVIKYLNICYVELKNESNLNAKSEINTKHYICSTHFLKTVIKHAKKIQTNDKVRKAFIFSFTLLQNSTTLKEFENYLIHIYNLFHQNKKTRSFLFSYSFLKTEILHRKLDQTIDPDLQDNRNTLERDKSFEHLWNDCSDVTSITVKSIKASSPFTLHFNNLIYKYATVVNLHNRNYANIDLQINDFYCPELFEIVVKRLYLMPMWSAVMLNELNGTTRLSNNPVENWFGTLKTHILNRKTVMPSVLVAYLYKRLQAYFFEHIYDYKTLSEKITKTTRKQNNIGEKKENWKSIKDRNFNREKGIYYQNINALGVIDTINEETIREERMNDFKFHESFGSSCTSVNGCEELNIKKSFEFDVERLNLNNKNEKMSEFSLFDAICGQHYVIINELIKNNQVMLEKLIQSLRTLHPQFYSNQEIDPLFSQVVLINEGLKNHYVAVIATPDGNCLYNSIATILFENEKYFWRIKLGIIGILLKYETYFKEILKSTFSETSFEQLIENVAIKNTWGNEFCLIAASILLNKPIYVYGLNRSTMVSYNQEYCVNATKIKNSAITISFITNHFVPLLSLKGRSIVPPRPQFNQFIEKHFLNYD